MVKGRQTSKKYPRTYSVESANRFDAYDPSVSLGTEAQTCIKKCPHLEVSRNKGMSDEELLDLDPDRLDKCFDSGGAMSQFVNGKEIIICPVDEGEN